MAFETKVYLVTEILVSGGETIIGAKLTHGAARDLAKLGPNRKVTPLVADKTCTQVHT